MRYAHFSKMSNVSTTFVYFFVAIAFMLGCSEEPKKAVLSAQTYRISDGDAFVLDFENFFQWTNTSADSLTSSHGQHASVVNANGWTEVTSVAISNLGTTIGDTATIDVQVPESPMYWGEVKLIIKVPSLGEWYRDLGSASLSGMSSGSYYTLSYDIPEDLQDKLTGTYDDLVFTVAINGPAGQYLLDNIQLGLDIESDTDSEVPPVDSFTVYLPDNLNPNDVVLGGSEYVKINDRVEIDDNSKICASNGISGMNLGVDVSMGTAVSEGDIVIRERCTVDGDLRTASTILPQSEYWVTGEELEYETFVAPNELTLHMGFPWTIGSDVLVPPSSTDDISPDTYNDLTVYSDSTLTLHAGVYRFRSVQIEPNAQIVLDDESGPVVVLVSDSMFYRGAVANLSGTFPQWFIGYSGTDMITFERTFQGTVMAPRAKINLEAVAIPGHEGNFYGNEIELFQDVKISHAEFTGWDDICGEIISGNCETPCPPDYVKEGGVCIHTKMVDCNDVAPQNATSTIVSVEITYTDASGWSTPADCAWNCDSDYTLEEGQCINQKMVDCTVGNVPENATSIPVQVEIIYTDAVGWSTPEECAWTCNTDYTLEEGACIHSKQVDCTDVAPSNAASIIEQVEITYTSAGGWSIPAVCEWSCDTDFVQVSGACINSQMVNCVDAAPSNAASTIEQVEITYTTAGGWTAPTECNWECNTDFDLVDGNCISTQIVDCVDVAPTNATSIVGQVQITYTTAGGWSTPGNCEWSCDTDFAEESGECIHSKMANCTDVAPNNAASSVVQVEITYTTAGGWSTPIDCEWTCNTDYVLEGDACINSKIVDCLDISPENASPVIVQEEITYTTQNGWSTPSDCAWECDLGYVLYEGACMLNGTSMMVDCVDISPENATSTIIQVEITYSEGQGWSTPPNCEWSCDADYALENDTCINSKLMNCVDDAPVNASSVTEQVEITYTDAAGWSTPSECAWECNADFVWEDSACIHSKFVDCIEVAPENAVSYFEQVEIYYSTGVGWTTPADCTWECVTDYDLSDGACINTQSVDCVHVAPENATSDVIPVFISFTTAGGWTTPADCAWACDTNFDLFDGNCINTKMVDCVDVAPENATSTIVQAEIVYTTAGGWSTAPGCEWSCDSDYILEGGECINNKMVDCVDVAPSNASSISGQVEIFYSSGTGWSDPAECQWICNDGYMVQNGQCIERPCIYYVDIESVATSPSGETWGEAFNDIQLAVDAAALEASEESHCQIWVADGVYDTLHSYGTRLDAVVHMAPFVDIYGGFTGVETDFGQRNWRKNLCALDGKYRPNVHVAYGAASATLDGFTLRNIRALSAAGGGSGGGISISIANDESSPLKIANCIFTKLEVSSSVYSLSGGAISMTGSTVEISNSYFIDNSADGGGGAIIVYNNSNLKATNCVFALNYAGYYGGALNISGTENNVSIVNSTMANNSAYVYGGSAIYIASSASNIVNVQNSIIWGNTSGNSTAEQVQSDVQFSTPITYSDVEDGYPGEGNIKADPQFLMYQAGVTESRYQLLPESPCIDAANGDVAPVTDIVANDRNDFALVANTGVGIPEYVEMGAFEFLPCYTDSDCEQQQMPNDYCVGNYNRVYASGTGICSEYQCEYETQQEFCDFGCRSGDCQEQNSCTEGDCCENGVVSPATVVCPAAVASQTRYWCLEEQCGTSIVLREFIRHCDGITSTCNATNAYWEDISIEGQCDSNQICSADSTTWECTTCGGGCEDGDCVTSKLVDCVDTPPVNAHSVDLSEQVEIIYSDDFGWSEPAICTWECDSGYSEYAGGCVLSPCIVRVDVDADESTADGLSWNTAFSDIQTALNFAAENAHEANWCEVWVKEGTYYTYKTADTNRLFAKSYVGMYGGFTGTETTKEERDWELNETILSGFDSQEETAQTGHILQMSAGFSIVDGFTIRDAFLKYESTEHCGAIFARNDDNQIRNCVFTNNVCAANSATNNRIGGAAIKGYQSDGLEISNCEIFENKIQDRIGKGVGIYLDYSYLVTIEDTHVYNNSASGTATIRGGGIGVYQSDRLYMNNIVVEQHNAVNSGGGVYIESSNDILIENSSFFDNQAYYGGAIYAKSASGDGLSIINSHFERNESNYGGAIYAYFAPTQVDKSQFIQNSSTSGGAIYSYSRDIELTDCIFGSNSASLRGGALTENISNLSSTNCVFYDNQSGEGGAIYFLSSEYTSNTMTLVNNTIADNYASSGSGGIHFSSNTIGIIQNSILWNNYPDQILSPASLSPTYLASLDVRYSNVQDLEFWGPGNISVDPNFNVPFPGKYYLGTNSPSIDAADGDVAPLTDIEGFERFDEPLIDNTGIGVPDFVDMGAFERQEVSNATSSCSDDFTLRVETESCVEENCRIDVDYIDCDEGCVDGQCLHCIDGDECITDLEKIYTINADFDEGIYNATEHITVPDQLQITQNQVPNLEDMFVWISNSGEGTISKIDAETGIEIGRYRTSDIEASNPSRTAIDSEGNVWVGNRDADTATKILRIPTDRNDDGVITTSTSAEDILDWEHYAELGVDEAIAFQIPVDDGPRALAVDVRDNVWIGGNGGKMEYYDGNTGEKLKTIHITSSTGTGACYGALVDFNGTLWVSSRLTGQLVRIDNPDAGTKYNPFAVHDINYIRVKNIYGIGIDSGGFIYAAEYGTSPGLNKIDPSDNSLVFRVPTYDGKGITNSFDGDIWVAHTAQNVVRRYSDADGTILAEIPVGTSPMGISTDHNGNIWVANHGTTSSPGTVVQIDPDTNAVIFTHDKEHYLAYNYSDMTGYIAQRFFTKDGSWNAVWDTGYTDFPFGNITWDSLDLYKTELAVNIRTSNDMEAWSPWFSIESGAADAFNLKGRYIETEIAMYQFDVDESPVLYDLTIKSRGKSRLNKSPLITTKPDVQVYSEKLYKYIVAASDDDFGAATFRLEQGPNGMTLDADTGELLWTPSSDDIGDHPVSVKAIDPNGAFDVQKYLLTVVPRNLCTDGDTQVCGTSEGECAQGTVTCENGEWGSCVDAIYPSAELCDELDNDCDGLIDETCGCVPGEARPVGTDVGECVAGTEQCNESGQWAGCQEVQADGSIVDVCGEIAPQLEVCDSYDNDCDGSIDEECECTDGEENVCGSDLGICQTGMQYCDSGLWSSCEGAITPELEICDGLDNDCDGVTDEGCECDEGQQRSCGTDIGECSIGTQTCSGGLWSICDGTVVPTIEVCDGLDNDCDGEVDENLANSCSTDCGIGMEICINGAWSDCTVADPTTEICDGLDNNCDGVVDDGCSCTDGEQLPCSTNIGACQEGVMTCEAGQWGVCSGGVLPNAETCDGLDNDCDGEVDEELVSDCFNACGSGIQFCEAGSWVGCTAREPEIEILDGIDNDCNGEVDDGAVCFEGSTQQCGSNIGECVSGTASCLEGTWQSCEGEVTPVFEICDGLDNDCNGRTDETCECQIGEQQLCGSAVGECSAGVKTCEAGVWSTCTGTEPQQETCDNLDNDCDGMVDENLTNICETACGQGVETCVNGAWADCTAQLPETEICDGIDNNCDGNIDEGLSRVCSNECGSGTETCANGAWVGCTAPANDPNYGNECLVGIGACQNAGVIDCNGNCSATEGLAEAEQCFDNIDNDCDGTTDEDCPVDDVPPTCELLVDGDVEIVNKYSVIGTASDEYLSEYVVELAPIDTDDYFEIAWNDLSIVNDELTLIDATGIANGIYQVRLTVRDMSGNECVDDSGVVTVTGERKIGQFAFSFTDISIPLHGVPITVTRTYNNQDKSKGDFGVGWNMTLGSGMKVQRTKPLGQGYWMNQDGGVFSSWYLETDVDSKVFVTFPDGHQERFKVQFYFRNSLLMDGGYITCEFEPLGDTTSELHVAGDYMARLHGNSITDEISNAPLDTFDPDEYVLTTQEGIDYFISRSEGLFAIEDTNGHYISIYDYAIVSNQNTQLLVDRDVEDRITDIWDYNIPGTSYEYDDNGDLIGFTDVSGQYWRYAYDANHNLISVLDPNGEEVLSIGYDEQGRLIYTADGFGHESRIEHEPDNLEERIFDKNGNLTRYHYDELGRVTEEIGPDDSTTRYTYDANNNKLSETKVDEIGTEYTTQWQYEYNGARIIRKMSIDPLGNTSEYQYNSSGKVIKEIDPVGRITEKFYDTRGNTTADLQWDADKERFRGMHYTYDSAGHVVSNRWEGFVSTSIYESFEYTNGRLTKEIDGAGHAKQYEWDSRGNKIKEFETATTDQGIEEIVTEYEYDDSNRLIRTIYPDGQTTQTEYNEIGKRSASIDKDGRRTEYTYDLNGNLIQTDYPDGSRDVTAYDANGNRLSTTDRSGTTTAYQYDSNNRLIRTTYPDGSSSATEYNILGQVTAQVDARGNRTEFEYDAAGRKILERNALNQETIYAYNEAGELTHVTGPNSSTMEYIYNDLGQKAEVIYPDGLSERMTYNTYKMLTYKYQRSGRSDYYGYDDANRLTTISWSGVAGAGLQFDGRGNKVLQQQSGNYVQWAYDSMNRKTSRTLFWDTSESWSYYPNGNLQTHTDFNGKVTTYFYDSNNRLSLIEFADGSEIGYGYDVMGRKQSVTQKASIADGGDIQSTFYDYDERGRLTLVTNPDGSHMAYTYDTNGNRTSVQTILGTTTYTYDALNRIDTVTDDAGTTSYTYDLNGKQDTVTYPNGTVADYDYDALGRLVHMENRTSDGTILSSFDYTLDAMGNRTQVIESTGRITDYTYQIGGLLLSETTSDNGTLESRTYTYDSVGNRKTMVECFDADCETTTYTYNYLYQLVSEATDTHEVQYFYDLNGNLLERADGDNVTYYTYDVRNQLINVDNGDTVVEYAYDADGVRTSKTVDGETVQYFVDKNRPYHQVLEEKDDAGEIIAEYSYGNQRIRMRRGGEDHFYHYDGQGSVVGLSDNTGAITDTYTYGAFGNLLASTGISFNPYLYTGEAWDAESGLEYLRARYYNPEIGRFMNRDTHPGNMQDPLSLNMYLYGNSNPVMFVDPSGNFGIVSVSISINIGGISIARASSGGGFSQVYWWDSASGRATAARSARAKFGSNSPEAEFATWTANHWDGVKRNVRDYLIDGAWWSDPMNIVNVSACGSSNTACRGTWYQSNPAEYFQVATRRYLDYSEQLYDLVDYPFGNPLRWMLDVVGSATYYNEQFAAREIMGEWSWVKRKYGIPTTQESDFVDSVERIYFSDDLHLESYKGIYIWRE